jgi:CBS domain-containing protein
MHVSQLMSHNLRTCGPGDSVAVAAETMWARDIGCLPVVDPDGRVVGMITDRDICMAGLTQGAPLSQILVESAMSRDVFSCLDTDTLADAERTMRVRQVRRLPVLNRSGQLVGLLSMNDLVREAHREQQRRAKDLPEDEIIDTLATICRPREQREPSSPFATEFAAC